MNIEKQLWGIRLLFIISLMMMSVSCQNDDESSIELLSDEEAHSHAESTARNVSADDIPKIMNYLTRQGNGKGQFSINQKSNARSNESDLVIGELQTREILEVSDQYNRKNYTFLLTSIESVDETVQSTFNLIIKESSNGLFSYITEYRPDANWIPNYRDTQDFSTFSGEILHYSIEGSYIAKLTLDNGIALNGETRNPCPPDGDSNSDTGNNGGNDGNTGDGNTDGGNTGDGSPGGEDNTPGPEVEAALMWLCNHRNQLHNTPSECNNPAAGGTWVIVITYGDKSVEDTLRCPDLEDAPVECHQENTEPCPYGCNADGTGCADAPTNTDPNPNIGVLFDIDLLIERLVDDLDLNTTQANWFADKSLDHIQEIREFLDENNNSEEAKHALRITINVDQNNNLGEGYNQEFMDAVNCCNGPILIISPDLGVKYYAYMRNEIAIIKQSNYPDTNEDDFTTWQLTKIYWEANLSALQLGLDVIGLIPGFGEVADIANGVIYTVNGDGYNASLSFAAAIPIAGWFATGAKWAKKTVNIASDINSRVTLKWIISGDLIKFGSRSQLRKVLQITDSGLHAHHIIPWARGGHPLVQKAAKSGDAFHLNEALNGIPRPSNLHLTGHSQYNDKIIETLTFLNSQNPSMTNDEAYDLVSGLTNHIRNLIEVNPNLNSGQIADLINFP